MRELFKELVLGENRYRIGKMTARTGSWVASQFASYVLPAAAQSAAKLVAVELPATPNRSRTMTEAEFYNLQDHCLAVCSRIRVEPNGSEVYYPLIHDSGRWNFDDLETDAVTVTILTVQALMFNITPFFADGAMDNLIAALTALPTTVTTTPTSTVSYTDPSSTGIGANMRRGTGRTS